MTTARPVKPATSASIRSEFAAASLKRMEERELPNAGAGIRSEFAAASLKHAGSVIEVTMQLGIRSEFAAASLKQAVAAVVLTAGAAYPQRIRCGLIEALYASASP